MKQSALLLFTLLLVLVCKPAWSASVAELQSAHHLQISSELIPSGDIVPGQRVELVITIATDRWFTGGTRLEIPEVPGLVILQTNSFASNSSENRNGQSWVVQRWMLDVFPQREGNFTIPPLAATVKVSDPDGNSIEGELYSPGLRFQVVIPQSLLRAEHWVAAPSYTVRQSFDRELDNLNVGDAFKREVAFEATDVMAMMLPTLAVEELNGLAAYPEPPGLTNSSNRGETIARRVEVISYVVEAEGQYQLPARDYFWWDTATGQLQLRFLPAIDITVGEGQVGTDTNNSLPSAERLQLIKYAFGFLLITCVIWILYRRLPRVPLARFTRPIFKAARQLNQMRKPALPSRLNPDSSAGE